MSETSSQDEAIVQFCGITGADEERARGLLEACQWNLELAINTHVDCDPEGRSRQGAQSSNATATGSHNSNSNNHRNFAVHSDDNDIDEGLDDSRGARLSARPMNPVARRLNAAGTSSSAPDYYEQESDGVRPPIAPVRQILNPNPIGYPSPEMPHARRYNTRTGSGIAEVVHDAFRDFQAEAQWHEMAQEGEASTATSADGSRRLTIDELFRPPLELMFRGSFASARESGTSQNRWLLVNIQDGREFSCQILNRDVWSNQTVRDIIKEHFIFWQVYHDSHEGSRYVQFYNAKKLPHVAIIDPRTGELMKLWPSSIDQTSFCDSVIEFLTEHASPDGSADANSMKRLRVKEGFEAHEDELQTAPTRATFYDQSEEAQLEAAIKASLQETEKAETLDETIELDDDTIEANDLADSQLTARDKEHSEKSPKTTEFNNNQISETSKSNADINQPATTVADALKAVAAARPTKVEGPGCRIALRFPDGSSLVQTFSAGAQLERVKEFVQMGDSVLGSSKIEFIAPPNRKLTESMMNETLEGLGLCPASRLEVNFCWLDHDMGSSQSTIDKTGSFSIDPSGKISESKRNQQRTDRNTSENRAGDLKGSKSSTSLSHSKGNPMGELPKLSSEPSLGPAQPLSSETSNGNFDHLTLREVDEIVTKMKTKYKPNSKELANQGRNPYHEIEEKLIRCHKINKDQPLNCTKLVHKYRNQVAKRRADLLLRALNGN